MLVDNLSCLKIVLKYSIKSCSRFSGEGDFEWEIVASLFGLEVGFLVKGILGGRLWRVYSDLLLESANTFVLFFTSSIFSFDFSRALCAFSFTFSDVSCNRSRMSCDALRRSSSDSS